MNAPTWKAITGKRMKIDPYCQRWNCSPMYFSAMYRLRRHLRAFLRQGASNKGGEKNKLFSISRKLYDMRLKLLLMTNRKLHMRFRLTPRFMTLDDLELYRFEFSENFAGFRIFWRQQQLNEWR